MNVVALFLKVPALGKVKTRLAKTMGDEGALMAYADLVKFLLNRLEGSRIHIHHTSPDPSPMVEWLGEKYVYSLQDGLGLGERLPHAMELEFAEGADKLIFIGGDCPFIDQARIESAFAALDDCEVVIGPATDGGYYLIGLKALHSGLFEDVAWGTKAVFKRTLKICRKLGLSCSTLPEESDVDDFESWERAKAFMDRSS